MQWAMPFNTPGVFEEHILTKGGETRLVAPVGVTFKGGDLKSMGQEPRTKATIYSTDGPDVKFDVQGTGSLNGGAGDSSAGGGAGGGAGGSGGDAPAPGQPALAMDLPKLYGLANGSADLLTTVMAVKWVLLSVIGMLATGFILLYRKGSPAEIDQKASKNVRGRS